MIVTFVQSQFHKTFCWMRDICLFVKLPRKVFNTKSFQFGNLPNILFFFCFHRYPNALIVKYTVIYSAKTKGGIASKYFIYVLMSFLFLAFQTRIMVRILNAIGNTDSMIGGLYSPLKCSISKSAGHERNIIVIKIVRSMAPGFGLKK